MKFLRSLFFGVACVGCVSAMESAEVSSIKQISDLFGKAIIKDQIIESKYGSLKFNEVVMPDCAGDKEAVDLLNEHFDAIKQIAETDDLLIKNKVAHKLAGIFGAKLHTSVSNGSLERIYRLMRDVTLSTLCRMIDGSTRCNAIAYFKNHEYLIASSVENDGFAGLVSYNGMPVNGSEFCRAMVYMSSFDSYFNKDFKPMHPSHGYHIERLGKTISLECTNDIPETNFFAWALYKEQMDSDLIAFCFEYLTAPYYNNRTLARDIIQGWEQNIKIPSSVPIGAGIGGWLKKDKHKFVKLEYFQDPSSFLKRHQRANE